MCCRGIGRSSRRRSRGVEIDAGVENTVTLRVLLAGGDRLVARIEHGDEFRVRAAPPG